MAHFDGNFAATGTPLDGTELQQLLAACSALTALERQQAIACYLSAGEGWDEAVKALRGAFASDAAAAVKAGGGNPNECEINQRTSEYLQWPALKPSGSDND